MKLAIVVDSSSGLTKKEAEDRGWYFLPLYLTIDGKEYRDGIDISKENFLEIYKPDSTGKTSCTPIGEALKLLEDLSKSHDFVVVYPISMGLSSQYNNLEVISKQLNNVFVVKSKRVCQFIVKDLVELEKEVLSNELTVKQAVSKIENHNYAQVDVLLYPKDINVLARGGRLAPSAAKLAKLLKIFPVIGLQDGKLEKFDKGMTFSKTFFNTSVDQYKKLTKKGKRSIIFLDTANEDADAMCEEFVKKANYDGDLIRTQIPPVIAIHTGYGAISIFFLETKHKLDEYKL
ncbi:MAG: DegV family protein [Mycoplasma sp.]|nr:DegV family protein [Mycoplasma sp.]